MKIYSLGPKSLAKAEGISTERAREIWSAAHAAIVYQGAGRLGTVILLCVTAFIFSLSLDGYCGTEFCKILEHVTFTIAVLLVPGYMLVATSMHAKKICDAPDSDGNNEA